MFFIDNIDRSLYRYHSTCDWPKKSMQKIEFFNVRWKKLMNNDGILLKNHNFLNCESFNASYF